MRYSLQRQAVYEAVTSTDCHPSAEWVYDKVKEVVPNISLGTVYRNLKELCESGLIDTVETEDCRLRYDGNVSPHVHFVCLGCGRIFDLDGANELNLSARKMGFTPYKEKIVLYGLCPECGNKE